jgi:hypothetical protein
MKPPLDPANDDSLDDKIVPIRPNLVPDYKLHTPVPELIDYCERLLGEVKSGEVQAIAIVKLHGDDMVSSRIIGNGRRVILVGEMDYLKYIAIKDYFEKDD